MMIMMRMDSSNNILSLTSNEFLNLFFFVYSSRSIVDSRQYCRGSLQGHMRGVMGCENTPLAEILINLL